MPSLDPLQERRLGVLPTTGDRQRESLLTRLQDKTNFCSLTTCSYCPATALGAPGRLTHATPARASCPGPLSVSDPHAQLAGAPCIGLCSTGSFPLLICLLPV